MKKAFLILTVIAALVCLSSCKKDEPVAKEQGPDWTKVELKGTVWKISSYSANLNGAGTIWERGNDDDITNLMKEGEIHIRFTAQ